MKRSMIVGGSILAVLILILVSFTSVASSNLLKTEDKISSLDKLNIVLETPLDRILQALFSIFLSFLYWWGTHQHQP